MTAQTFTLKTLADRWGCHPATIRRMCHDGRLLHFTIGDHQIRISAAEVERAEGKASSTTHLAADPFMEAIDAR